MPEEPTKEVATTQQGVATLPAVAQAWEQQVGESSRAFHAFQTYRDLDPKGRTFKAVQDILYPDSPYAGKSLRRWAERFRWVERVGAWERALDRKRMEVQLNTVKDMTQRHIDEAVELQNKGLNALKLLSDKDLSEMSVADARLLVTEGAKLERLARGLSTEKHDQTNRGGLPDDLSTLPEDELRRLANLAASLTTGVIPQTPA